MTFEEYAAQRLPVLLRFVYNGLTGDELEQIVAGMTLATWEDPSTWYELEDALP